MSSARRIAAQVIEGIAAGAGPGLSAIPGVGPIVGPAVAAGLGLVADLVRAGDDAPLVIERIRRSPEILDRVRAEARWDQRLDERWPETERRRTGTQPSMPAVDTEPGPPPDIYLDIDLEDL